MTDDGSGPGPTRASFLLAALTEPAPAVLRALTEVYGSDESLCAERMKLVRRVLQTHIERFGDEPVRLFRSPGRINLRGMHVDTHGGYLNLMTHHREVVVTVASSQDGCVTFSNIDSDFADTVFPLHDENASFSGHATWLDYITSSGVENRVATRRGDWSNYVRGAVLRVALQFPRESIEGFHGVVGSDIPSGAALSSSAALCLALISATLSHIGRRVSAEDLIVMAQDAEWYTGSRCGRSDQAAEVLGKRDSVVNVVLTPFSEVIRRASYTKLGDDVRILVINSFTKRSISGMQLVDYTRNRFAYSMAMEIARQECERAGVPPARAERLSTLASLSPSQLDDLGGSHFLYALLRRIPEVMSLDDLRERYKLPNLDAAYEQYFGTVSETLLPTSFSFRGPLL
ncbi:MAG: hypothetical protein K1Y02_03060, partial [Candidatus Hydrogenedentes bacterium]|nr:hypothetical protein [Candidatus Hydrogenedentota bacterium]